MGDAGDKPARNGAAVKKIVVLAGDGEYESHRTMRTLADRVQAEHDVRIDFRVPDVLEDMPDFPPSSFGDLSGLDDADLLMMYTRFRVLPDEELSAIARFLERGGDLLALRTANHAFRPVPGSAMHDWAAEFGDRVLGSAWTRHHGHSSSTEVSAVAEHWITGGVPARFAVRSWLYETHPPHDATVLLHGDPVDPEGESVPSPVAWVRERGDQRIFYCSLGHQEDMAQDEVRTVLDNAVAWCLHLELVPDRAS
jgi:type 1 glutamine amidotransferase